MQDHTPTDQRSAGHETPAINIRAVVWWLVALGILILVTFVLMELLMAYFVEEDVAARPSPESVRLPVTQEFPLLDERQSQELLATRESAHHLLHEYKWLDRRTGVARIPIERAMDILERDGLPNVPTQSTGKTQP